MNKEFSIGIDLGTSNSVLAESHDVNLEVQALEITQSASPDSLVEKKTLPSCIYIPHPQEFHQNAFVLPWQDSRPEIIVGEFAKENGAIVPDRLVSSAKSWLCNSNIERRSAVLPWKSESAEIKLSPVAASKIFLEHMLRSFVFQNSSYSSSRDHKKAEIILAVPASFDEVARALTHEAAELAGWGKVTLIEEPLAAFYSWIASSNGNWRNQVSAGDIVLVCDVGGGTADFSLISVEEKNGQLELNRISVGDHILLGGDNMDLALAYSSKREIESQGATLSKWQFLSLIHLARQAKERLLSDDELEEVPISIANKGASLFESALSCRITKKQCNATVLDGFIPYCDVSEMPNVRRSIGLQEFGLPYAADPALSKHLAKFLVDSYQNTMSDFRLKELLNKSSSLKSRNFICPTAILFNGGIFKSLLIRQRLLEVLSSWSGEQKIRELEGSEFDLAVAKGAAYYGMVRIQGSGLRIRAGTARSYYIGVESSMLAVPGYLPPVNGLCVVPQGSEEGSEHILRNSEFGLVTGEPVGFRFFASTKRAGDVVGAVVEDAEAELEETARLAVVLPALTDKAKELVPVHIHSIITELGMLELWLHHTKSNRKWRLDFNLRKSGGEELSNTELASSTGVSDELLKSAHEKIAYFYGKKGKEGDSPKGLVRELEQILGKQKNEWNSALLRSLWTSIAEGITRRGRSPAHESVWFYLAGYCLRPGYGVELDQWRIEKLWRVFTLGMSFPKENNNIIQFWMMFRRVAGGLDSEQQEMLQAKYLSRLQSSGMDEPELVRLFGSLERISKQRKEYLGDMLVERICGRKTRGIEHLIWAWQRLASRSLLYAGDEYVISSDKVEVWLNSLLELDWSVGDNFLLNAAAALAARLTGDCEKDISPSLREKLIVKMQQSQASEHSLNIVKQYVEFSSLDRLQMFGEELPVGLKLLL